MWHPEIPTRLPGEERAMYCSKERKLLRLWMDVIRGGPKRSPFVPLPWLTATQFSAEQWEWVVELEFKKRKEKNPCAYVTVVSLHSSPRVWLCQREAHCLRMSHWLAELAGLGTEPQWSWWPWTAGASLTFPNVILQTGFYGMSTLWHVRCSQWRGRDSQVSEVWEEPPTPSHS